MSVFKKQDQHYPGYQRFFLVCDEELCRPQAEDTSGEAARKKSPRNQSAKHPDSGCFGVRRVVIGSVLSKGWRSRPEAFRAGHFLRLDRNRNPRMKSLWNPG